MPKDAYTSAALNLQGKYVEGLSGITCVEPAEAIMEIVDSPQQKEERTRGDELRYQIYERDGYPPNPEEAKQG